MKKKLMMALLAVVVVGASVSVVANVTQSNNDANKNKTENVSKVDEKESEVVREADEKESEVVREADERESETEGKESETQETKSDDKDIAFINAEMQNGFVTVRVKANKPGEYIDINGYYCESDAIHNGNAKYIIYAHSEDGSAEAVCYNTISDTDKSMAKLEFTVTVGKGKDKKIVTKTLEEYTSIKDCKIEK